MIMELLQSDLSFSIYLSYMWDKGMEFYSELSIYIEQKSCPLSDRIQEGRGKSKLTR